METEVQEQATEQPEPQPGVPEKFPSSWEEVFKHPRFKELNTKAQAAQTELEKLRAEQRISQEAALKEQNKYKELYEQRENELKTERLKIMRLKVGKALPDELAELLQGETEEELKAHAEKLMKFAQPKEPGDGKQTQFGLPPLKGGAGNTMIDLTKETDPKKIREYIAAQQKQ
jgi:hypothetical protein